MSSGLRVEQATCISVLSMCTDIKFWLRTLNVEHYSIVHFKVKEKCTLIHAETYNTFFNVSAVLCHGFAANDLGQEYKKNAH